MGMKHKILYTSDLHGNELQYKKLVDYSIKISADSIVIGGDIAPKNFQPKQFVDGQRYFLQEKLPGLLSPLKKSLPNSRLFLMMGNDDCKINLDVLERENNTLYQIIHKKRVPLTDDFDIVGYSYVPITPFGIKDWEKFDLSDVPSSLLVDYQHRKMTNYRLEGFKTTSLGWEPFQFNQDSEKSDSIQKDLSGALFRIKADRTLYVIHTPPNHTSLDMEIGGRSCWKFCGQVIYRRCSALSGFAWPYS